MEDVEAILYTLLSAILRLLTQKNKQHSLKVDKRKVLWRRVKKSAVEVSAEHDDVTSVLQ